MGGKTLFTEIKSCKCDQTFLFVIKIAVGNCRKYVLLQSCKICRILNSDRFISYIKMSTSFTLPFLE